MVVHPWTNWNMHISYTVLLCISKTLNGKYLSLFYRVYIEGTYINRYITVCHYIQFCWMNCCNVMVPHVGFLSIWIMWSTKFSPLWCHPAIFYCICGDFGDFQGKMMKSVSSTFTSTKSGEDHFNRVLISIIRQLSHFLHSRFHIQMFWSISYSNWNIYIH